MDNIETKCENIIAKLKTFPEEELYLGPPIVDNRLELLELEVRFTLPEDFKYMLKRHNGISVVGTEVLRVENTDIRGALNDLYKFEHFVVDHKMPPEYFPFSPDGYGNYYCLNLAKVQGGICPVAFWQWDYEYSNISEVEECNVNFLDWIEEVLIGWGKEKL